MIRGEADELDEEDIALTSELGFGAKRLSISWPRVLGDGSGPPNQKGLDFYNRMLDTLLAAGIQPYCTLYHWDLPQTLQDKGGWESRDTPRYFADYSGYVATHLSDRVKHFMTTNELRSFTELGYSNGVHAPGLQVGQARFAQVCHYAVLAHGLAVQAIRASAKLTPALTAGLATAAPALKAIRVTWNGALVFESAAPLIRFGKAEVKFPPDAFLQPTGEGEVVLRTDFCTISNKTLDCRH